MSSLGFHLQQLRGSLNYARTVDNESSRFAYSHKPSAGRSLAAIAQPQDFLSARAAWVVPNHVIQFIAGHADCCVTEKFNDLSDPEILALVICEVTKESIS